MAGRGKGSDGWQQADQPSAPIIRTHPLICCCYGVCLGPVAAFESMLRAFVNMYTACFVLASLCLPGMNWWDRMELCLELFREGFILFALALSFMVPGLAACAITEMHSDREWTYRPIPTVCGSAHADRAVAITCCFPNVRTFHAQYQDSCLPTGEDCIECCCVPRAPSCCFRCCPYNGGYNPDAIYNGGTNPSSRGSPELRHGTISDVQAERSPGAARRHSFTMRYKTLAFKPDVADPKLEEALKQVLSFDVSGDLLATATGNSAVHIWSVRTHTCLRTFSVKGVKVAFSPDGGFLAVTVVSSGAGHVCVFSLTTGMTFTTPHHRLRPTDNLCWARDGTMLAVTGETNQTGSVEQSVFILSASNGKLIRELVTGDANHSAALAWSPHNPTHLAIGTAGFKIKIVDVTEGDTRCELIGCRTIVRSIAWSPHNDWQLAAGSSDGTVRVFDVTTGVLLRQMGGLRINVWCVTWSPTHPDYLATLDGSIRVFNVVTWEQRYEIPCASVSTSMTMAWLPGFQHTLLSAEANGVRMFELRGLEREGFLSTFPSIESIPARVVAESAREGRPVSGLYVQQPAPLQGITVQAESYNPQAGRRGSSSSLTHGTGLDQFVMVDGEDDDAVVYDDESTGEMGEHELPPLEVIVSHQMGSRDALNADGVDDSEEGMSFV